MDRAKLLFYIGNCFSGFGYGLFLFAFGVGNCVLTSKNVVYVGSIVVGILLVGLAWLGCWGASHNKRKVVNTYSLLMGALSLCEIIHLVIVSVDHEKLDTYCNFLKKTFFVALIFTTTVTILTTFLAVALSIKIVKHTTRLETMQATIHKMIEVNHVNLQGQGPQQA